ncbi:MAG: hypothetical protein ABSH13_10000 [Candidatus Acidiferrum sp.]
MTAESTRDPWIINDCHLVLLAAFRPSIADAVATSLGFTWGTTAILFIVLPQEQRGLIPHSTSLDARTSNSLPQ